MIDEIDATYYPGGGLLTLVCVLPSFIITASSKPDFVSFSRRRGHTDYDDDDDNDYDE